MDSDEDNDVGRSWISFKSLKKAANVKEFFQRKQSPGVNGYGSINSEGMANTVIHSSISFSQVHKKYQEDERKEEKLEQKKEEQDTARELEQSRVLLSSLESQLHSQSSMWQQRYHSLESLIRDNEKRLSLKPPIPDFSKVSFSSIFPLSDRVRPSDHSACQTEIEDLRQMVSRQKKVIEGLEGTIESLREKLEEVEGGRVRRKHTLSSM